MVVTMAHSISAKRPILNIHTDHVHTYVRCLARFLRIEKKIAFFVAGQGGEAKIKDNGAREKKEEAKEEKTAEGGIKNKDERKRIMRLSPRREER